MADSDDPPYEDIRPSSPETITQTRVPRVEAPAIEHLACFFLNELQHSLPIPDDPLFNCESREVETIYSRDFLDHAEELRPYHLASIDGLRKIRFLITISKTPEGDNIDYYMGAECHCCGADPSMSVAIGPSTPQKPLNTFTRQLDDGTYVPTGLFIQISRKFALTGPYPRRLDAVFWEKTLQWLRRVCKTHFTSCGQVRSISESTRWDGILDRIAPWNV